MNAEDLVKFLDEKIRRLREELEYYEAARRLVAKEPNSAPETTEKPRDQDLNSLPWRPYRDGGGEWIYRDEAPEELATQLIQAGKPVKIGDYTYSIKSGTKGKSFISRRPAK